MLCTFEKIVYPKDTREYKADTYMVALYRALEKIPNSGNKDEQQIKAVGHGLPVSSQFRYDLKGHWNTTQHGRQFEVTTYEEVIAPTREGIITYLANGPIKGIGPVLAERIYDMFGEDTLETLDKKPEMLLSIPRISKDTLKKIMDSYMENRGGRDVIAFLMPYGITAKKALLFYQTYGTRAVELVKEHPYKLCEIDGIGFLTADKIAMNMGMEKLAPERLEQGLLYTLKEAESQGHLCMEKTKFFKECKKLLQTIGLTDDMLRERAEKLENRNEIVYYEENVYRAEMAFQEIRLSVLVAKLLENRFAETYEDLEAELDNEERKLGVRFAPEQRKAVKMALTRGLSIVTGGPGTGKTLLQRAILDIYMRNNPCKEIRLAAPTGRAARRMEQSTGQTAMTVHKLLCLNSDEDGVLNDAKKIEADLILVDEVSMLDIHLAVKLFSAIRKGAQLILVGDADQLPSVGPGAILSELISSECIPVVRLDKVFRQETGSRIAVNAKCIHYGTCALEYGDDFQLIESKSLEESSKIIEKLYLQETIKYGVDNVALLSPFRQKTETGVNALNVLLRDKVNPPSALKTEIQEGRRIFRVGDKVMQTKNNLDVNNGDIGYIKGITDNGKEKSVEIDFGDGRIKDYDSGAMDNVDWGYATTIHKSQGSEYETVIINLQTAHFIMLTRQLLYTAITRSKKRVIIVGEKRALCVAINRIDTEKRGTCLAQRIQEYIIENQEN